MREKKQGTHKKQQKQPPPPAKANPAKSGVSQPASLSQPLAPGTVFYTQSQSAGPASRPSHPSSILQMQKQFGNAAVQRLLQQKLAGLAPPLPGVNGLVQRQDGGTADSATADTDTAAAELQDFRDNGPYPAAVNGQTIAPGTGMGGFNASYNPTTMRLKIVVNIEMNFVNGMTISGNTVSANDTSLAGAATGINNALSRLTEPDLSTALDQIRRQWQWAGGSDPRIVAWMAEYKNTVQNAWSSGGTGIVFQSSNPGWDSQLAYTDVVVNTTNTRAPAPGGAGTGPQPTHCQADIFKTPDANIDFGAAVGPGTAASGTDQDLSLGSGQLRTPQNLLTQSVYFGHNSATLTNDMKRFLRQWIISFQAPAGGRGTTIDIIGRANTVGGGTAAGDEYNRQLSLRRAQAVDNFLRTERVEGRTLANATTRVQSTTGAGSAGATNAAEWRRVDILADEGQNQNVAIHEFGHMIGMHDEYASTPQRDAAGNIVTDASGDQVSRGLITGTGGDVGDATGSDPLVQQMGLGHSLSENNDNIMSLGNTIRPQHYATFMEALRTVTGRTEWRLRS